MPKRELRPSTVMRMQQQKQQEQQSRLMTPPQAPPPALLPAPSPVLPQLIQPVVAPIETLEQAQPEPVHQPEIREEQPAPAIVVHEDPIPIKQPQIREAPKREPEYYPQHDLPPQRTPFEIADMRRIEDLTRNIMYREPQKSKFGKNNGA